MKLALSRRSLIGTAAMLPFAAAAAPALADEAHDKQMREDFPWLARYADDNATLIASGKPVGTVFMGDSITEGWQSKHPAFFADTNHVCRGISGQTTPQMVLRMMADVVHLKPKAVHIMAGTNDIAGNTGPMTAAQTEDNLTMMTEVAKAAGIHVILASIPPSVAFPWRPGLAVTEQIRTLNRWIEGYARAAGATWVDYTPALATAAGGMKPGMAVDGVHPTAEGYAVMEGVLAPVVRRFDVV
ncbi:GDSL-type esterase/lipase family protein [Hephaestia mangrovi]|uniref:GDSL-type esterase/lipase family protein n=1 Tax=Hephaestia mangrovi TaxID=2873268 RepID=UPI001CA77689|nr:GDSL-type esterase/lipase family protein [Hephaestia mangrovi]MBY8828634.1 GDSL family lipase [Hephaestia mangrovi]